MTENAMGASDRFTRIQALALSNTKQTLHQVLSKNHTIPSRNEVGGRPSAGLSKFKSVGLWEQHGLCSRPWQAQE
jgi:hypothetical protein